MAANNYLAELPATLGELAAELVVPQDHLGAEPHDQEQRAVRLASEQVVLDLDSVYGCAWHGAQDLRNEPFRSSARRPA